MRSEVRGQRSDCRGTTEVPDLGAHLCNLTSNLCNPLEFSAVSVRLQIEATRGSARTGKLITPHGELETPGSMPVGTLGSVTGFWQDVLQQLGAWCLFSKT